MSVGTDHIDQRKCEERNIYVARTPDVASDSAAELTIALILITVRRIAEGNTMVVTQDNSTMIRYLSRECRR